MQIHRSSFRVLLTIICFAIFGLICGKDAFAQGLHWQQTNGPFGGAASEFQVIGNSIYAGTQIGLFVSTDTAAIWQMVYNSHDTVDGKYTIDFTQLKTSRSILLASCDARGLARSVDSGRSWHLSDTMYVNILYADDSLIMALRGPEHYQPGAQTLQRSTDAGSTWTQLSLPPLYPVIRQMAVYEQTIIVPGSNDNFRSIDKGLTWNRTPTSGHIFRSFGSIFVSLRYDDTVDISTDLGISWKQHKFTSTSATAIGFLAYANSLFVTATDGVYRSLDSGLSWKRVWSAFQLGFPIVGANGTIMISDERSGIIRSQDTGNTWVVSNTGFASFNMGQPWFHGSLLIANASYNSRLTFISKDQGKSWLPQIEGFTLWPDSIMYVEAGGKRYSSIDTGRTLIFQDSSGLGSSLRFIQGNNFFAFKTDALMRSSDQGVTWQQVSALLTNPRETGGFGSAGRLLYFGQINANQMNTSFYQSEMASYDSGRSWYPVSFPVSFPTVGIAYPITASINGHLYTVGTASDQCRLYEANDSGTQLRLISEGLPYTNCLAGTNKLVFIGTRNHGVYFSIDSGKSFSPLSGDLPHGNINYLALSGSDLYAVEGGTIYHTSIARVGVEQSTLASTSTLRISANPVASFASIHYSLAQRSVASFTIYDMLGRAVMTPLPSQLRESGVQDVRFNASSLPQGVYVGILRSSTATMSIKIVVDH
jgi:photosystem II stability/assembly factor-like uncharacterized protein